MKSSRKNTLSQVKERTFYDINLRDEMENQLQQQKSSVANRRREATQAALEAAAAILDEEEVSEEEDGVAEDENKDKVLELEGSMLEYLKLDNKTDKSVSDVDSEKRYATTLTTRQVTALEASLSQKEYMQACRKLKLTPMEFVFTGFGRRKLALGNHFPSDSEILSIAIGLLENIVLREISFVNNNLTTKSIMYLCAALSENDYVKSVRLTGNKLSDFSISELVELFLASSITDVDLSDNKIDDKHGELIAKLIKNSRYILSLNLSYNTLSDSACVHIGAALDYNDILLDLDLSWNCIRTNGCESISVGLQENFTLKTLNLKMNGISTDGAGYLARLLSTNHTLIELDVCQNRIFDKGVIYLSKMLAKNQSLMAFKVAHNPISTTSTKALLEAVLGNINSPLRLIDLSGAYLDKNSEAILHDIQYLKKIKIELHGVVQKATENRERDLAIGSGIVNMHPAEILRFYIEKTGSRLVDVYRIFDRDNKNLITRDDFLHGLEVMSVPLTELQVDELIESMDTNGTGEINFGQMMEGDKEARMRLRKRKEKQKEKQRRMTVAGKRRMTVTERPTFDDI